MITLITGAPGAGKSAALVDLLLQLGKDRPLFVNNIPDLQLPHIPLEEPDKWPDLVPDGAVIVIDEVQNVWRPAGPGAKIPESITKLETHRHRGLDFYIVTQMPRLVHTNVRALVGRHVHLRDVGILGRYWYEWPECQEACNTAWKGAPIKSRYTLPKHVFDKYKSASLHVKPVRGFPKMLVVAVLALIGTAALGVYVARNIYLKTQPQPAAKPAVGTAVASPQTGSDVVVVRSTNRHLPVPAMPRDLEAFKPPPPVPVDALEYAGSLVTDQASLHLFKRPDGAIIKSPVLVAQGYKVHSDDGCTVTVSYGAAERVFLCAFPIPAPSATPKPDRGTSDAFDRLAQPSRAPALPGQRVAAWSDDGLAYARRVPQY